MSRKDYVAFAELVHMLVHDQCDTRPGGGLQLDTLVEGMADIFAGDNPRFDRGRFLVACLTPVA